MRLYLAESSALTYWRGCGSAPPSKKAVAIPEDFIPCLLQREASWIAENYRIAVPVVSAVSSLGARRRGKNMRCCVHDQTLPRKGYYHLGKDTFVATPEITLAQMACRLSGARHLPVSLSERSSISRHAGVIILASLMTEFCGNYVIDPRAEDGFLERKPLTSLSQIRGFLNESGNFRGRKVFETAASFAFDNSNSPAETNLALLEYLKFNMGGMSFSQKPLLNEKVETARDDCAHERFADQLFGGEIGEVVEYNGSRHEGERANDDDRRRIELRRASLNVTVVNSTELFSAAELEWALQDVCRKVGTTGRHPADYKKRRADLRALLFELTATICHENKGCLIPAEILPPRR